MKEVTYTTGRLPMHIRRTTYAVRGEHVSLPFIATLADEHPEVVAVAPAPAPPTPPCAPNAQTHSVGVE
jgi:hypothetical protein